MKLNQKNNKFKLVKFKNKLVPIILGISIPIVPLTVVASEPQKRLDSPSPTTSPKLIIKNIISGLEEKDFSKIPFNKNVLPSNQVNTQGTFKNKIIEMIRSKFQKKNPKLHASFDMKKQEIIFKPKDDEGQLEIEINYDNTLKKIIIDKFFNKKYNVKTKVITTNDDFFVLNTWWSDPKFKEYKYDDKIIFKFGWNYRKGILLLKDIEKYNSDRFFQLDIERINKEHVKNGEFTKKEIEKIISSKANFDKFISRKAIVLKKDQEDNQNIIDTKLIVPRTGKKISMKIKWEKNEKNLWNLRLIYDELENASGEEDDSIYLYKLKKCSKKDYNKYRVFETIEQLENNDFDDVYKDIDKNKLPSHNFNTNNDKKAKIFQVIQSKLDEEIKSLIFANSISFKKDDNLGKLIIQISLDELGFKEIQDIEIGDFMSKTNLNKISKVINGLKNNDFLSIYNKEKSSKKSSIVEIIKNKFDNQKIKSLITSDLIQFESNDEENLVFKISLKNFGLNEIKEISITKTKLDLIIAEIEKLSPSDFNIVYNDKNKLPSDISNTNNDKKDKIVQVIQSKFDDEEIKSLISSNLIDFKDDDLGKLIIEIDKAKLFNNGKKNIEIDNFISKNELEDRKNKAYEQINKLETNDFNQIYDKNSKNQLASSDSNKDINKINLIFELIRNKFTNNQIYFLINGDLKRFINFRPNDKTGELTIQIRNNLIFKNEFKVKEILIKNFITKKRWDSFNSKILSLKENILEDDVIFNKNKLASDPWNKDKNKIINAIKEKINDNLLKLLFDRFISSFYIYDSPGKLKISIYFKNYKSKSFIIEGFITESKMNKTIKILDSLESRDFEPIYSSDDKNKFASDSQNSNRDKIEAIIRVIKSKTQDSQILSLIDNDLISFDYDNNNGELIIKLKKARLKKGEEDKIITISDFKKQTETHKQKLVSHINSLKKDAFEKFYNDRKNKLPSDPSNKDKTKIEAIINAILEKITTTKSEINEIESLITSNLINFQHNDDKGKLIISFNLKNFVNKDDKNIEILGFKTKSNFDKEKVLETIQKLVADDFKKIYGIEEKMKVSYDSYNINENKKQEIISLIKEKISINNVEKQEWITTNSISFDTSKWGKLIIIINLSTLKINLKPKRITISNFIFALETYRKKALTKINSLLASDFDHIYNNKNKLASNLFNQNIEKKKFIVQIIKDKIDNWKAKELINDNLISFEANDESKKLTIKIDLSYFGSDGTKNIDISGFPSQLDFDKKEVIKIIKNLVTFDFNDIYTNKDKLASDSSNKDLKIKTLIVNKIKEKIVDSRIQNLIATHLISFSHDNIKGKLTIKIDWSSFGDKGTKDVVILGFKTQAQLDNETRALEQIEKFEKDIFNNIYIKKDKLASDPSNSNQKIKLYIVKIIQNQLTDEKIKSLINTSWISFSHNNDEGKLTIEIHKSFFKDDEKINFVIEGFTTQLLFNKQEALKVIENLSPSDFDFLYIKNRLASDPLNINKNKKNNIVKIIEDKMSLPGAKLLISDSLISFEPNDKLKKLTIKIDKSQILEGKRIENIDITGFKTQLELDKMEALSKIDALSASDFNDIYNNKNKLASDPTNIDSEIKATIVKRIKDKINKKDLKNLIFDSLISFESNNTLKKLTIKIDWSPFGGEGTKDIDIVGFKTQAQLDAQNIALKKVKSLSINDFSPIYDKNTKNQLASHFSNIDSSKKTKIVTMIKNKITDLAAKALIKDTLITFDIDLALKKLTIKINLVPLGEKGEKVFPIIGFKNQLELDKMEALSKVNALSASDFNKIYNNKNKLASDPTNTNLKIKLAIIKLIQYKMSLQGAKALISYSLISFEPNNTLKKLTIKIVLEPFGGEGEKVIDLVGFKNKEELDKLDKMEALSKIDALLSSDFNDIYNNKNKLASDPTNIDSEIKTAIVTLIQDKMSLRGAKLLISDSLISFEPNDELKKLTIKIDKSQILEGKRIENIDITGFKTQLELDKMEALSKIDALSSNDFDDIYNNKNKLASDSTNIDSEIKATIVKRIKDKINKKDLKNLIFDSLISFESNNTLKKLTIKIDWSPFGGEGEKVIDLVGFKTQLELDKMEALSKIDALSSNDFNDIYNNKNKLASDSTNIDSEIKATIVKRIKDKINKKDLKNLISYSLISFDIDLALKKLTIKIDWSPFGGKGTKNIDIIGFQNQLELDKMEALSKVNALSASDFNKIYNNKNKLASDPTNTNLKIKLAIIKLIQDKMSLLLGAKALISYSLISFEHNDESKELTIKIDLKPFGGEGEKVIDITGFKNQEELDKMEALSKIDALLSSDFNDIYNNKNKLASDPTNIDSEIKAAIVTLIQDKMSLRGAKALISYSLISFEPNNTLKKLTIKIDWSSFGGRDTKNIDITGFQNQLESDRAEALYGINILLANDFENIYNEESKKKFASNNSHKKVKPIIEVIQKQIINKNAKLLITPNLISFTHDNIKGKLTIKIDKSKLGGEGTRDIDIINFQTPSNLDRNELLNKIKNLKASDFDNIYIDKNKLASDLLNSNQQKKNAIFEVIKKKMTRIGAKALVSDLIISFEHNDESKELTIKIDKSKIFEGKENKQIIGQEIKEIDISGFNNILQEDIKDEKNRIEALSKHQIKKNIHIINANTLTKNELDLKLNLSKIKGFSYSISHPAFTINGDYDVKVDIKKDDQTATAIRKISIVGINKAKRKLSLQRSSGLSKGAIAGIVIGVFSFVVSISFVLIKFFKSKKQK